MRRIQLLFVALLLAWPISAWAQDFSGGSGTAQDPWQIATAQQLDSVRNYVGTAHADKHFVLVADIDLWPYRDAEGWAPIGSSLVAQRFHGSLDGSGHVIRNLRINRPQTAYQGLFAYLHDATIQRLTLENVEVYGADYTGALAGYVDGQLTAIHVSALRVSGVISGVGHTGGVVGYYRGSMRDVATEVTVSGTANVGGVIGTINGTSAFYNLASHGSVLGEIRVGGVVGNISGYYSYILIADSYSQAHVEGNDLVGGFVGKAGDSNTSSHIHRAYSSGLVSGAGDNVGGFSGADAYTWDSYFDRDNSGQQNGQGSGSSYEAKPKTTAQMRQRDTFAGFNFHSLWSIVEGSHYPVFQDLSLYAPPAPINLADLAGDGSAQNPYQISNADELNAMRQDLSAHYVLTADIDLSASVAWTQSSPWGIGWEPIGNSVVSTSDFTGSLNGNGFAIRNLATFVSRPGYTTMPGGLFARANGADFRNLRLENFNVYTDGSAAGGLVGSTSGTTTLRAIHVTGQVRGNDTGGIAGIFSGSGSSGSITALATAIDLHGTVSVRATGNAGGLFGSVLWAYVSHVSAEGKVSGSTRSTDSSGGLAGHVYGRSILANAFSRAAVEGSGHVGGLVGNLGRIGSTGTPGYISHSYSTGLVTGTLETVGGLLGQHLNGGVFYSYWDKEASGQQQSALGTGMDTAQMRQRLSYDGFNFSASWRIDEGLDYPKLRDLGHYADPQPLALTDLAGSGIEDDPYLITSADELNAMRLDIGAHYRLTNDIDLSATVAWNSGQGWEPVGHDMAPFTGVLDGAGHVIRNLSINRLGDYHQGLFAYTYEALIKDLSLENVAILAEKNSGGLAGIAQDSQIDSVHVSGLITAATSYTTEGYTGGLAGAIYGGTVNYSSAAVDIRGSSFTGGLAGLVSSNSLVRNSYAAGSVSARNRAGGLVGRLTGSTLTNCYSQVAVSGNDYVGGLVGEPAQCFGCPSPTVNSSYSAGAVSGSTSNVGGFSGTSSGYAGSDNYWDVDTSGQSGAQDMASGRTTAQMQQQATYAGWSFGAGGNWQIIEGSRYPHLQTVPLSLSLSETSHLHGDAQAAGHAVQIVANTVWSATTEDDWITIESAGAGVDNGTLIYAVEQNNSCAPRSGTITVSDDSGLTRTLSVVQAAHFDLAPSKNTHGALASSGHQIRVAGNSNWSATTSADWITITEGASGEGAGVVLYRLAENNTLDARNATITLSANGTDHEVDVTQSGAAPYLRIDPQDREHWGSAAAGQQISVNANLPWSTAASDAWIGLASGADGTGEGTTVYAVQTNESDNPRLGTLTYTAGPRTVVFWLTQEPLVLSTIGGTVSGLSGTLVLQNNGGDDLSINADGAFTFATPLEKGATFEVAVLNNPPGQICSVSYGSGTLGDDDVSNVLVSCQPATYTVSSSAGAGGTVSPSGNQTINHGSSVNFTVTPNPGHHTGAVGGTCPAGSWSGLQYTTGAIGADCHITFAFEQIFDAGDGTELNPFEISTPGQLSEVRNFPDAYFVLGDDVDLSGAGQWEPIGTYAAPFTGQLDGGGKTIANLSINTPAASLVGLFGYADGAMFSDIVLSDVAITGLDHVGALVGRADHVTIRNVEVTGSVTVHSGDSGGLAGELTDSTVANCHADVSVLHAGSTTVGYLGGLIGNLNRSSVTSSSSAGRVEGDSDIGGLIGIMRDSSVSFSHSESDVFGERWRIGGLVGFGFEGSLLFDSHASGRVEGLGDVGGLVGTLEGTVDRSYATGNVVADSRSGALVGFAQGGSVISFSHASGTVTGTASSIGGLAGRADGLISRSYASGNVISSGSSVGGLVGDLYREEAKVEASYAIGTVEGTSYVGGLVGSAYRSLITDCFASGSVIGGDEVGGLVGELSGSGGAVMVENSYAIGRVIANTAAGGLAGKLSDATIVASYYDSQTSGQSDTGKGEPRTSEEMKSLALYGAAGWDIQEDANLVQNYPFIRLGWPSEDDSVWVIGTKPPSYYVTAVADTGGSITPEVQIIVSGNTAQFTVTAHTGYLIASVSGCGGSLSGTTYVTAPIVGACTINASFQAIEPDPTEPDPTDPTPTDPTPTDPTPTDPTPTDPAPTDPAPVDSIQIEESYDPSPDVDSSHRVTRLDPVTGEVLSITSAVSRLPGSITLANREDPENPMVITTAGLDREGVTITIQVEARSDGRAVHRMILSGENSDGEIVTEVTCELPGAFTSIEESGEIVTLGPPKDVGGRQIRSVVRTDIFGESRTWFEVYNAQAEAWERASSTLTLDIDAFEAGNEIVIEGDEMEGLQIRIETRVSHELHF